MRTKRGAGRLEERPARYPTRQITSYSLRWSPTPTRHREGPGDWRITRPLEQRTVRSIAAKEKVRARSRQ